MHRSPSIKLLLFLMGVGVGSFEEINCQRKEAPRGVQVLDPSSRVTLRCTGQITVEESGITLPPVSQARRDGEDGERTRDAVSKSLSETTSRTSDAVTVNRNWASGKPTTKVKSDPLFQYLEGPAVKMDDVTNENGTKGRAPPGVRRVVKDPRRWVHRKCDGCPIHVFRDAGETLHLGSLHVSDSGNYSCYQGRKIIFSVNIVVEAPPKQPSLSCHRKSPTSKIRCEWIASQLLTTVPQCHLMLQKGWQGQITTKPCKYSKAQKRCWCVLDPEPEGSRDSYWASLCVYNFAGHATSPPIFLHPQDIVKPDPPYNVSVRAEVGNKYRLIVTWNYPCSWKGDFYKLKFHLQYFMVLQGEPKGMQEVFTQKLNYTIQDATPQIKYQLRVRAREEFDMGYWSDWSPQMYAYTWTEPEPTDIPGFTDTVSGPWAPEGSGMDDNYQVNRVSVSHTPDSQTLLHASWVIGACMLLALLVLSAYVFRHKAKLISKLHKLSRTSPSHPAAPTASAPPTEEGNPLVLGDRAGAPQPLDPPFPQEAGKGGEGIHLTNLGYFLVPKD